ncbi:hypothetical protein [Sediminicola luteus]|uniref:Uncharacterized protein n=1 Tax=Sediminicola luteus TaxID=319238 RepID=A0A2A4GA14_9FLAO|nr:hypothetical protein [Sediminicola luteus]PCE65789.1 hypothetical protein B7P33_00335 [Sediminicola luteus]
MFKALNENGLLLFLPQLMLFLPLLDLTHFFPFIQSLLNLVPPSHSICIATMPNHKFKKPSQEETQEEKKTFKQSAVNDAAIIGVLIGIAIYATYNHGLGPLSFLPLLYLPVAAKNKKKRQD